MKSTKKHGKLQKSHTEFSQQINSLYTVRNILAQFIITYLKFNNCFVILFKS